MKSRSLLVLVALALALTAALVADPAAASPGWLPPLPVLAGHETTAVQPLLAVAGTGRVVVGRHDLSTGVIEVQVKEPGRRFGAVTTLHEPGTASTTLLLAAGPRGTLAAVWNDSVHTVASFLPPGRSTWTSPRAVAGNVTALGRPVVDGAGRIWLGFVTRASGRSVYRVVNAGPTGPVHGTTLVAPPDQEFPQQPMSLALVPGGAVRTVVQRTRTTEANPGEPNGVCAVDIDIVAADFPASRTTATGVRTLAHHVASGQMITPSFCSPSGGKVPTQPVLVRTPGVTTAAYTVQDYGAPGFDHNQLVAFERPDGGGWSGRRLAGSAGYCVQTDLVAVGPQRVSVGFASNAPTQHACYLRGRTGAAWGGWRTLVGAEGSGPAAAAGNARGAVFGWRGLGATPHLQMRRMTSSSALTPIVSIAATAQDEVPTCGVDGQGNAVAALSRYDGSAHHGAVRAFDAAGPVLSVTAPRTLRVGTTVRMRATAVDTWSPPASRPVWRIDGGPAHTGTSLSYEFRTVGRHRVVVRSVDARGTATVVSRTVSVHS